MMRDADARCAAGVRDRSSPCQVLNRPDKRGCWSATTTRRSQPHLLKSWSWTATGRSTRSQLLLASRGLAQIHLTFYWSGTLEWSQAIDLTGKGARTPRLEEQTS